VVERAWKLCIRQRPNSLFSKHEPRADSASVRTSLMATCIDAGGNGLDALVALQAHRAEVCADPSAWLPWTSQARLAPPEATRRQSRAICARSGSPFHRRIIHSRAAKGPRASAVVGHQRKRP
jgi:hypothetical protein